MRARAGLCYSLPETRDIAADSTGTREVGSVRVMRGDGDAEGRGKEKATMARTEFCPYCKSTQPEQAAGTEEDGAEGFCQVCDYPLRAERTEPGPFRPATIL